MFTYNCYKFTTYLQLLYANGNQQIWPTIYKYAIYWHLIVIYFHKDVTEKLYSVSTKLYVILKVTVQ